MTHSVETVKAVVRRYVDGERIDDIASECGVGRNTLFEILKREGLAQTRKREKRANHERNRELYRQSTGRIVKRVPGSFYGKLKATAPILVAILLCCSPVDAKQPPRIFGVCGSANGVPVASAPTSGLCSAGSPSTVSGLGPWTWSCIGSRGGATAACGAPLFAPPPPPPPPAPIDGVCGPANGTTGMSAPTTGLCSAGTATTIAGTGPWTWSCVGLNGGTTAACLANLTPPPPPPPPPSGLDPSFIIVSVSAGRSIMTPDGTWTFAFQDQRPQNLLLNGLPVGDNMAMIALRGGALYALRHDNTWWAWNVGAWSCAAAVMGADPC